MSAITYAATERASYEATLEILNKYVKNLPDENNYSVEDIKTFFTQTKNALATVQNYNHNKLTMADMMEKTKVGTYGAAAESYPAILKKATTQVKKVVGNADATKTADGKGVTADYELATQLKQLDIIEKGTPNGALRAAMDFIEKSLPSREWDSFFNKPGNYSERKDLPDIDLYLMSENAIKNTVSPGTVSERNLLKELED